MFFSMTKQKEMLKISSKSLFFFSSPRNPLKFIQSFNLDTWYSIINNWLVLIYEALTCYTRRYPEAKCAQMERRAQLHHRTLLDPIWIYDPATRAPTRCLSWESDLLNSAEKCKIKFMKNNDQKSFGAFLKQAVVHTR